MNMRNVKDSVMMSVQSECIEKGLKNLKIRRMFSVDEKLYLIVSYIDRNNQCHKRQMWRAVPVIDGYDFSY